MLINFSNHPSNKWSAGQQETAIAQFGKVRDFPFPPVGPSLQNHELDLLVAQYELQIEELKPMAVHIMGEMTFTYRLVSKLKQKGIRCIASTTDRDVREDEEGNKISTFRFVQFREY